MHKTLHMEESPHKCPVCNRSFNQRSNLKTHLLTHTDHKPYECLTCGKVFRRNCDLRRHALTHTIGGDVPPDAADQAENEKSGSADERRRDAADIDDEDDDTVVEVDSPVHSPVGSLRRSPSIANDLEEENGDEEVDLEGVNGEKDDENGDAPPKEPRLSDKDDLAASEQTHCHHNGGQMHYTMRPIHEMGFAPPMVSPVASVDFSHAHLHQSPSLAAKIPEAYMPMLHVRRDLHHKEVARGEAVLGFVESMPMRKRTAAGYLREPMPDYQQRHKPLNLSNHPMPPTQPKSPAAENGHDDADRAIAGPSNPNRNEQRPPPPKRTGFSIEDIMRR